MEVGIIVCLLCDATPRTVFAVGRTMHLSLYFCAAFWKLTTSFLDYRTSCATILFAELTATILPDSLLPLPNAVAEIVLRMAPALTVAVEFAIGSATGLLDCILFHWIDTLKVRKQDGRPLLMNVQTGLPLPRAARHGRRRAPQ